MTRRLRATKQRVVNQEEYDRSDDRHQHAVQIEAADAAHAEFIEQPAA